MSIQPPSPTGAHVAVENLAAYANGALADAYADAVEVHLMHCESCRQAHATLTAARTATRRDATWALITDSIDQPTRWNRSSAWVRLAIGTPALLMTALVLAITFMIVPLVIAMSDVRAAVTWFLALAPAVPVIGALVAYGAAADPAGELAAAAPMQTFRIVVIRTTVVLTALLPAGLATSLLLPAQASLLLGWFLPALGLCAIVLAVGTRHDPRFVAGGLAAAWAVAVFTSLGRLRHLPVDVALERTAVNSLSVQLTSVAVILVALGFIAVRHDDLDRRAA